MLVRVALLTVSNLRAALGRPASLLTLMLCAAAIVSVATALAATVRGLSLQLTDAGGMERAVVLEEGAASIRESGLTSAQIAFVHQTAGSRTIDKVGITYARLAGKGNAPPDSVPIRGITPEGLTMRSNIRIVRGRMFERGRFEVVAGAHAAALFRGADIGDRLAFALGDLDVVGVFESGDQLDSVFLVDADTIFGGRLTNAMVVDLGGAESFGSFRAALHAHPALTFGVHREDEYLENQASIRTKAFREIGLVVGALMALGGVFCSMNVMMAAVSERRSETAMLQAIGFPRREIAASILLETLTIVAVGACLGSVASWLLLNEALVREGGSASIAFRPVFDGWALLHGLLWVVTLLSAGSLLAIRRALRNMIHRDLAAAG